ncbi:hypothetical protein DdX_12338 [Ditylenchus destructor]|uniref:Uncharacterized protein n=1 Tax=Ditylenchus destructor TaxID=166010 RepID=A0AAD4N0U7_9BILA|nr:hypothetical protein DdX_12338 [Ditylenchus destructor]
MVIHRLYAHHFNHVVNPDGSTRTECLCVFPGDNRKCQFVAVRDPGGHLRRETLEDHLRKHHHEEFKAFQEKRDAEREEGMKYFFLSGKEFDELMAKEASEAQNNSSN